jgi:hypothetical protein
VPTFTPPLLLAGPVLRKVTAAAVNVWVATSVECEVQVNVYSGTAFAQLAPNEQRVPVPGTVIGSGARTTVGLGVSLNLAVVTAPIDGVPPDTVCSYDIVLDVPGPTFTGTWNLGGLKLLDLGDPGDDYQGGLGFAEGHLPSFVTPPADVASLRLIHGSCYGLKGDGHSLMPELDDIVADLLPADATAQKQRPHLLMLTGDQIYADDVSTALLPSLTSLGANLLQTPVGEPVAGNVTETVPIAGVASPVPVDTTALPPGRRLKLVRTTAGMTSDDGDDHLIGFGEFAAMYLLAWTGRLDNRLVAPSKPLWPADADLPVLHRDHAPGDPPGVPVLLKPGAAPGPAEALLTPIYAPEGAKQLELLREKYPVTRRASLKAGDDGDKVRRVLANVPVLTICDDHEVTDDWFITGAWRARVLGSSLGRAIMRNALLAYVMFQAWGNTPEAFATPGTPEAQLLELAPKLFLGPEIPDPAIVPQVDTLLGLDDLTGGGTAPRVAFNYHVDIAGARLVVLDTRNHREYVTPNGPPGLLSSAALDAQLPVSSTDDVPVLIVVSPAPVLGPRITEEILEPLITRTADFVHLVMHKHWDPAAGYDAKLPIGDLFVDVEHWSARPAAFERFLARVSRCPRVVILAGDVHYAASYVMDYQRFDVPTDDGGVPSSDPPPPGSTSRIVNFTSSPIQNEWPYRIPVIVRTIGMLENLERIGFDGARLGWTRIDPPVFTGGDLAAGEGRPLRARLRREPVVLPMLGWTNPHSIRPPEWAYRVAPIFDTRSDDIRFAGLADAGFTQVLGAATPDAPVPDPPLDTWLAPGGPYDTASSLHAANMNGAAVTRTLVFQNNVGLVTFSRPAPDGPLSVQMALYFIRPFPASEDEKPQPFVVHATQLEPVPLAAPDAVGPTLSEIHEA